MRDRRHTSSMTTKGVPNCRASDEGSQPPHPSSPTRSELWVVIRPCIMTCATSSLEADEFRLKGP